MSVQPIKLEGPEPHTCRGCACIAATIVRRGGTLIRALIIACICSTEAALNLASVLDLPLTAALTRDYQQPSRCGTSVMHVSFMSPSTHC